MSIPIPAGMEQAPVTWTLGHTTGTEALRGARGLVRFEPTAVAVAYPDATVLPSPITARVLGGVMDSVDLTVNDPELWNWRVTPELGPAWPAFHIDVPVEGVDLATAVVVPGIGPIRAVTGPRGTTEWGDLTGKPATYPPAAHTHAVGDVTGLQDVIDRLTYDSGWRDVSGLLINGWSAYVYPTVLRRVGDTCELRSYLLKTDATDDLFLAPINGFRHRTSSSAIGVAHGTVSPTPVTFTQDNQGFKMKASRMGQSQMLLAMTWTTTDPIPATLPGTPA